VRLSANEVASTAAERACLAALREATGAIDGAMERHCLRVFLVAERLAADGGTAFDREVVLCAALLHDVGAYPIASRGGAYVTDGRLFTERTLRPFSWSSERLRSCLDAVEHHHELRPQWGRGVEVELIRRADLVDVLPGLVTFGLPRPWLRGVTRAVPRRGIYRELARIVVRLLRERPATIPRIFFPGTAQSRQP
jgi:hypothetical protein